MQEGFAIWANPSSPHAEGRKAKQALEDARDRVKKALKWDGEVIFTSGASEALAIGLQRAKVDRRIVSAVEHDAVFRAAPDAEVVPVEDGAVSLAGMERAMQGCDRAIAAVQHINSETGTSLLPFIRNPVVDQVRAAGGWVLSDCSQSAGKGGALPDCDIAVVSAHKLGGPIGIGALLVKDFAMLQPMGGHERGYRQGTENLPTVLGFAAALEMSGDKNWSTTAEQQLDFKNAVSRHGQVLTPGSQCAHILAVAHPSIRAQALLIRLDAMGFAVSAGSACSSGTLKKSRVLDAFGIDDDTASRTIRVSIGWTTTGEELDRFAEAWASLC